MKIPELFIVSGKALESLRKWVKYDREVDRIRWELSVVVSDRG